MKKAIWILIVVSLAILLAGCAGKGGNLESTYWKLTALGEQPALADAIPELIFGPNGELSGSTGCNRFSGSYTVNGQKLTIQTGAMTMMACEEPVMKQEQDFLAALAATETYEINDDQLVLNGALGEEGAGNAPLATFSPLEPIP